jgi:hypothetical protein
LPFLFARGEEEPTAEKRVEVSLLRYPLRHTEKMGGRKERKIKERRH